jgi:hypothetical protein
MVVAYAILILGVGQVAIVAGIALYHAIRRQWIAALGVLVGLAIALSPLYFWKTFDELLGPIVVIALVTTPILVGAYAVGSAGWPLL